MLPTFTDTGVVSIDGCGLSDCDFLQISAADSPANTVFESTGAAATDSIRLCDSASAAIGAANRKHIDTVATAMRRFAAFPAPWPPDAPQSRRFRGLDILTGLPSSFRLWACKLRACKLLAWTSYWQSMTDRPV